MLKSSSELTSDINSFVTDSDFACYKKYGGIEGNILDIGTGKAKSAIALANENPKAIVYTVDNGEFPLSRGWFPSLREYVSHMESVFINHGIINYVFQLGDVLHPEFSLDLIFDLFHLDCEESIEGQVLEKFLPKVHGVVMVRNYHRFSKEADRICNNCEFIEDMGRIRVYRT